MARAAVANVLVAAHKSKRSAGCSIKMRSCCCVCSNARCCTRIFVRFAHVYFGVLPFSFLSYYRTHANAAGRSAYVHCVFFCAALLLFIATAQFLLCSFYFAFFTVFFVAVFSCNFYCMRE